MLIGAMPKYHEWFEAYRLDVPTTAVHQAMEQRDLWARNAACLAQVTPTPVSGPGGHQVTVWACPSGDVPVKMASSASAGESYRWVGSDTFGQRADAGSWLIRSAVAGELAQTTEPAEEERKALCTSITTDGKVVVVFREPDGRCVPETISPFTGAVEERQPANCDERCPE